MKKGKKYLLILIFSICAVIAGFICWEIGYYEGECRMFEEAKISPSGNYKMESVHGYDLARYVRFIIIINKSEAGNKEYISEDKYYVRHRTIIEWGKNDTVWVYSGDVGTYYWELINDEWVKKHSNDEALRNLAPDIIKNHLDRPGMLLKYPIKCPNDRLIYK